MALVPVLILSAVWPELPPLWASVSLQHWVVGEQWQYLFPSLSTLELLPEVHILLMCRQLSLRVTPPTLLFLTAPVCPLEIRPLNKRGISREWSFICWRGRGCSEEGFVSHSSVDASKLRAFTGVGRTSRWSPPSPCRAITGLSVKSAGLLIKQPSPWAPRWEPWLPAPELSL